MKSLSICSYLSISKSTLIQLGITNFKEENLSIKERYVKSPSVLINIGIVGDSTAATDADKVVCIEMKVYDFPFEINVAINNIA
ncbi:MULTISPECIES: hypothetical protein [Clostridium]|uniref:hypothetical protein n=1 Tax=Clostridium TaxID=1485 RepID=UPI00069D75B0|nr:MULTISPECIES: hypothetical protein [Clostridium]KOF55760.1 hypothetical protein AGR56_18250 [Clostridium sp. DMHC 10]MCD2347070.1 hypothetical protein [Clostridium guangxiense]